MVIHRPLGARRGRGAQGHGGLQALYACPHCGQGIKRWDRYKSHLRDVHGHVPAAAPPYEPPPQEDAPDSDDDPIVPEGAARPPVNHALSGAPQAAFWNWDVASEEYKVRTALPDVSGMGLPRSVLDEYDAQMEFVNTQCKPVLQNMAFGTAYKPVALSNWEADKATFDERTSRLVFTHQPVGSIRCAFVFSPSG